MKVLAVDPGYDRVGIALLSRDGVKEACLHSECFETDRRASFEERLYTIGAHVEALMKKFNPEMMALERLYFNTNQKTAMQVAEMRGALLYLAAKHTLPVYEFTPAQIKQGVTGSGRSDKQSVERMVHILLPLAKKKRHDDEYDALALALTCLATVRTYPRGRRERN
jgi:crossover junction endodeoxyribonuclease RuvC